MGELILKQAIDKLYCLFWWDSTQKTFSKIAEGRICKQLDKYGYRFLLGNDEKDCQVYMQKNGEVQIIPEHCLNVVFIDSVCTYERDGEWYAFVAGNEILLGEKYNLSLSLRALCQFECGDVYYFVSGDETKDYVLSMIYRSDLIQGNYYGVLSRQKEDYLLAGQKDGNYSIVSPAGFLVYDENKQPKKYFSDDKKQIYLWDEAKSSWKMIAENGFVLANNALITHHKDADNRAYSILFEVFGTSLKERARGKFKVYGDGSFRIGGISFAQDYERNLIDFEKWHYSFWRRLKNLLGK